MPFVFNGIGTWYYGKRRIYTHKNTCEFCGHQTSLLSYDTTLFFVVFFIPVIPLGQKRILNQCSNCQKHRALSRAKWEEAKRSDADDQLEKLRYDPNDRDTIMKAIGVSLAYQDEPLFNSVVEMLGNRSTRDAGLQAQLGHAYSFFARWPLAEQSYRASLAVEENEGVREQLAWALLKQDCPDEARFYLQHVLDQKKVDSAGMVYYLVECYQAQGRHDEALEIMDERDKAFPQWVTDKDYQRQRKTSMRYQGTEKKVRSAFLAQGKAGYHEGNWTAWMPHWIAAFILLGGLSLYFGSAIWIGQARAVYLVNGTNQPYSVLVQGSKYAVPPNSAMPIRVAEGDVPVAFIDAQAILEPLQTRIETPFWSRPFVGYTFVINPDQSAIVLEEESYYAAANAPMAPPPKVHFGQAFYSMSGIDYEFTNFPASLQVKGQSQVKKTRVSLAPTVAPELRLSLIGDLEQQEQIKFCRKLLQIDPNDTLFLYWLSARLTPQETIEFVETRLDDRPILVEWHRVYQSQMERAHPETDLLPRYRKLLVDTGGHADALYLLGRADPDLDESEKLYRQAASANPPSGYATNGLGYRAWCEARYDEACQLFNKALPLLNEKAYAHQLYQEALLANGSYDLLLNVLQRDSQIPGRIHSASAQMVRVYAIRGDKKQALQKLQEVLGSYTGQDRLSAQNSLESMSCCCNNDVAGYLKKAETVPSFETAFLRGQLKQAADLANSNGRDASTSHGLLYLEATRSGAKDFAADQWAALLADLGNGGREERLLADMLAGRKPLSANLVRRLSIEPGRKRVLLAVVAQRYPDQGEEMLALASRLNYQRDAVSLCLGRFLK